MASFFIYGTSVYFYFSHILKKIKQRYNKIYTSPETCDVDSFFII